MSIRQYNCVKMSKSSSLRNIFSDKEFWLILFFNAAIFYTYLDGTTSASTLVFLYYLQSVFVGIQYFIRLLALGRMGVVSEDGKVTRNYGTAFFFLFHYGFFHFVYAIFLVSVLVDLPGEVDFEVARVFLLALIGNTILSTISDIKRDREEMPLSMAVMFQPYFRIIPMHLLIIFGFNSEARGIEWAFLLFIGLKTIADTLMHVVVNKTWKGKRPNATGGWI